MVIQLPPESRGGDSAGKESRAKLKIPFCGYCAALYLSGALMCEYDENKFYEPKLERLNKILMKNYTDNISRVEYLPSVGLVTDRGSYLWSVTTPTKGKGKISIDKTSRCPTRLLKY